MTLILGIESSCDETAAAVVEDGRAVRANVVSSQNELHRKYHGVVPEIASRAHLERIGPVVQEALTAAGVGFADIDAVAVGNRPGLIGSLLVGVSAAKAIAWAAGKPLIGIDHIQAHLYASALYNAATPPPPPQEPSNLPNPKSEIRNPKFFPPPPYPALGLVVSGGHSSLYAVQSPMEMRLLGKTIDDAVGEAYDKAAVILDAGYPGGPQLDRLAQQTQTRIESEGLRPDADVELPRSMLGPDSLEFSFSGLKTALLYKVRGTPVGRGQQATFPRSATDLSPERKGLLAASFQRAAVDTLILKLERALDHWPSHGSGKAPQSLLIGGGVSANSLLRRRVVELGKTRGLHVGVPPMAYCLDNAAMIAGLAHHYFIAKKFDGFDLPVIATM